MSATGLAIEASGLVKHFREVTALDGFELEVTSGSVHGLLGPNGAGKTTAVRVLTTLIRPDGGVARVAGHAMSPAQRTDGAPAFARPAHALHQGRP